MGTSFLDYTGEGSEAIAASFDSAYFTELDTLPVNFAQAADIVSGIFKKNQINFSSVQAFNYVMEAIDRAFKPEVERFEGVQYTIATEDSFISTLRYIISEKLREKYSEGRFDVIELQQLMMLDNFDT